jgi:hypothetical protein
MPATTDYWVNDRSGDPLLVITGEIDAALTKAMPRLLREVRGVIGGRKVTIIFDRGGWSPQLFTAMIKDGFNVLTYRKGHCRRINERQLVRRRAKLDGAGWTIFYTTRQCACSRPGCACGKSRACATAAIRRT